MTEHLIHTTPEQNNTQIQKMLQTTLNLTNLDKLNAYDKGGHVLLISKGDAHEQLSCLMSEKNIPNPSAGYLQSSHDNRTLHGGYSKAPTVLIIV